MNQNNEPFGMNGLLLSKQHLIMTLYSFSILLLGLLLFSCSNAQNSSDNEVDNKFGQNDSLVAAFELKDNRTDIDKAMDALNDIQVSGDGGLMLYLTFPNIYHRECTGAISTFEISREELHDALLEVMNKNNRTLTNLERSSLASLASKPWSLYTVKTCGSTTESSELNQGKTPPRKGTWIITEIFGVSDLLINW